QTTLNTLYILSVLLITQSMSLIASVGFSTASGHAKLNMYFLLIFDRPPSFRFNISFSSKVS
ncbi:unnamed protein product, partial [marine sediment metagenome]